MIEIKYDRANHHVTVKGHAGRARRGRDLVCASVTALTCTLARVVEELNENNLLEECNVRLEVGDAEISLRTNEYSHCCTLMFDTICRGYEMLAVDYPRNISYIRA